MTVLNATSAVRNLYANIALQRIFSNIGWGVISQVGGKGIFFLVTIYLARVLGAEEYGSFTYAQSIVLYFWIAVDLGIDMYGSREIASDKPNAGGVINALLTLRIIGSLIAFGAFLLILFLFRHKVDQMPLFIGCSLYLITRAINVEWAMRGFEKFKYIALANFATFIIMLFAVIILVRGGNDLSRASFVWSLSYVIGGIILLYLLDQKLGIPVKPDFDIGSWLHHLAKSIHFTISGGLLALSQYLPIIFLGILASAHEVGLFSAPYGLILGLVFVISLVPYSLYPVFSELYIGEKRKFRQLHNAYMLSSLLIGFLTALVGFIFADRIVGLVFGDGYRESASLLKIMIWFVFLYSVRSVYGIVIAASGLQRYYTLASALRLLLFTVMFFSLKYFFSVAYTASASISLLVSEAGMILILKFIWDLKNEES